MGAQENHACSAGCVFGVGRTAAQPLDGTARCRALTHQTSGEPASHTCALRDLAIGDVLGLLPALEADVQKSHLRLRACVALLRERRATWREIGHALEVSRQAAWERFHETDMTKD